MKKIIIDDNFYILITRTYDLIELKEINIIDKKTKKPTGKTKTISVDRGYHKDLPHALIKYAKLKTNSENYDSVGEYLDKYENINNSIKIKFKDIRKED